MSAKPISKDEAIEYAASLAAKAEDKVARLERALVKRWTALVEAKRIIAALLPANPDDDKDEWNDGNIIEAREWLAKQENK